MQSLKLTLTILLIASVLAITCGRKKEETDEQNNVLSINNLQGEVQADEDGLENNNDVLAETDVLELVNKPTFGDATCVAPYGCLKGYISHGLSLIIKPETTSDEDAIAMTDIEGNPVTIGSHRFRDSQDFGDRFYNVFIKPLVPVDSQDAFDYRIIPTVKRDNFATGFELYSEGLNASDDHLKMAGEGNFILGNIEPFNKVALRAVKRFRIEIIKKNTSDNSNDRETREITCLEISANIAPKVVTEGAVTNIAGLRNFTFYYTENEELCKPDRLGQNPSFETYSSDYRTIAPTGPNLPN